MDHMFCLENVTLDSTFTIEMLEKKDSFHIIGNPRKLITGYTVYEIEMELDHLPKMKCSLQFKEGCLKYMMAYPDYREFLVEPERWDHPTVDGSVENEACLKWIAKYILYENKKKYAWGSISETFESWTGKAMFVCEFK